MRQTVEQLLAQLEFSEHDRFAVPPSIAAGISISLRTGGKSGKQIERCLISTFRVAESLGFKGDFRQWQELLRIGD